MQTAIKLQYNDESNKTMRHVKFNVLSFISLPIRFCVFLTIGVCYWLNVGCPGSDCVRENCSVGVGSLWPTRLRELL